MADILLSPNPDLSISELVDWLEIKAFFAADRVARLDEVEGDRKLIQDAHPEDTATADAELEEFRSNVYNEIERRQKALTVAYPFMTSENGERLEFSDAVSAGRKAYLFCLLLAHVHASPILAKAGKATARMVRQGRYRFQIICTIAAAGLARGPAISFGFPRPHYQRKFKTALAAFVDTLGEPGVVALAAPRSGAKIKRKDEGIDTISWPLHPDGPPVPYVLFGQAASGEWEGKSVHDLLQRFIQEWINGLPTARLKTATFIPHAIANEIMHRETPSHGQVIHRFRLPHYVEVGARLAQGGMGPVQSLDELPHVHAWLNTYRAHVGAPAI